MTDSNFVPPLSAPAATPEPETRKIADPREALFHIEQEAFAALGGGTMSVNAPARRQTVQSLASVLRAIRAVALPHSEAFLTPAAPTGGEAEVVELLDDYAAAVYGSADDSYPTSDAEVAAERRAVEAFFTAQASELATLRKENERLREPFHCTVCGGQPLKSGRKCICGGIGTEWAEAHGLREACFDYEDELDTLRARVARLAATRSLTGLTHTSLDHNDWRDELLARIDYARAALTETPRAE